MFDQFVLPFGFLVIGAIECVVFDRAAWLRRGPSRDRGDYWARIVACIAVLLAFPLMISTALASVPTLWQTGRHLHFDLTGGFGLSPRAAYRWALAAPFAVWTLFLLYGLAHRPGDRESARWIAGAIGSNTKRYWILLAVLPLAAILLTSRADLGGGPGAFPGAVWAMLAVLAISLIGVACSAGTDVAPVAEAEGATDVTPSEPLQPWPEALRAHGITSRHVVTWPATGPLRPVAESAGHLESRLRQRGATAVAPELIEAIEELLAPGIAEESRSRVVFAADNSGQTEVVALAAEVLHQQFHAETLVVTAGDPRPVAARFQRWLPGQRVIAVESPADIESGAVVMVADAQMLSDSVLPRFKNPRLVKRFGLVVWWHLEAYTGVLAANLWAISRRLTRLLRAVGRPDVRTLAFVRSMPHGDAQLTSFVRQLLPHAFPFECQVHVPRRFPRDVQLHVLESHQQFFTRSEGRNIHERNRHLPLVAARVSVAERWPTYLEVPPEVEGAETEALLQAEAGAVMLRKALKSDSTVAGAEIRKISDGDVLSLAEIVGHGGRAADGNLPHHVGVTLTKNPYVDYILSTLGKNEGSFPASRRLVWAPAHPSVMRRHLLLALDELPDTWTGLLKNFLWNEKVIRETLEQISGEDQLTRKEVRFLDDSGELRHEQLYKSRVPPSGDRRPLDTVGTMLINVRDPSAGDESEEGVRMRIDPERLTIQAYPYRVFVQDGQRYRIREWNSIERAMETGWLACDREDVCSETWRKRNSSVFAIESADAAVGFGHRGKLLSRLTATLHYEEEVVGALQLTPNLTTLSFRLETLRLARPIVQSFVSRALILRFPEEDSVLALSSLAQALRHVLPVHLGVGEDSLEVVPLTSELVHGRSVFGLAVVDLYPRGIGLVDAIGDDNTFLLQLLQWTRDWLAACACQSDQGCDRCVRSPSALAANHDQPPVRGAALHLLRQVL
ncbi:MAG TPA: DUF1998 domain-containing protein [Thermoanaerobaculia bacterium]|nr:DUF1998 domain-containing protein [Thermoanaerobaculia bacterium]